MSETAKTSKWIYVRWFVLRFALLIYDILAVNVAHYLALIIRFYVQKEFHSAAGPYLEAYRQYAVVYTVFCVVVFCCCKLYSSIWKYAGFNDLNRIIFANVVCVAAHVAGTLLFVMRMPITFYCIGAALQLCLIAASRFSYMLLMVQKDKLLGKREVRIRAMVVGTGATAKTLLRELDRKSGIRPMCVLNYKQAGRGSLLDGIPVVDGMEKLKAAVEKYKINYVIIASASMPQETRNRIRELCEESNVETQDYSGFFMSIENYVTFKNLADRVEGPVELVIHGLRQRYADGKQAQRKVFGRYLVKSVSAGEYGLVIELEDDFMVRNDLNADWVKDQEKEMGEEISFF